MEYEIVYTERKPGVLVSLAKPRRRQFETLSAAMAFARYISSNVILVDKPELREVA